MANVTICDRCGKTIEPNLAQKFGFNAWRYSLIDWDRSRATSYDCDLCVECGEKLGKFLDGAELTSERPDDALLIAGA